MLHKAGQPPMQRILDAAACFRRWPVVTTATAAPSNAVTTAPSTAPQSTDPTFTLCSCAPRAATCMGGKPTSDVFVHMRPELGLRCDAVLQRCKRWRLKELVLKRMRRGRIGAARLRKLRVIAPTHGTQLEHPTTILRAAARGLALALGCAAAPPPALCPAVLLIVESDSGPVARRDRTTTEPGEQVRIALDIAGRRHRPAFIHAPSATPADDATWMRRPAGE